MIISKIINFFSMNAGLSKILAIGSTGPALLAAAQRIKRRFTTIRSPADFLADNAAWYKEMEWRRRL
jgi:hypothetical protein